MTARFRRTNEPSCMWRRRLSISAFEMIPPSSLCRSTALYRHWSRFNIHRKDLSISSLDELNLDGFLKNSSNTSRCLSIFFSIELGWWDKLCACSSRWTVDLLMISGVNCSFACINSIILATESFGLFRLALKIATWASGDSFDWPRSSRVFGSSPPMPLRRQA